MVSSVDLGKQLETFVGQFVKAGRYNYRVEADRVTAIHILHGARDYEARCFPKTSSGARS